MRPFLQKISIILLLLSISSTVAWATDYYLSPTGNDNHNGTSASSAWQSLSKINSTTFLPGDRILLQAGGVWDGQLWPKGSGNSSQTIIIDQYGSGNKPVINGNGTSYPSTLITGAVMLYNQSYWEINNLEVTNYHPTLVNARAGILVMAVSATIQQHIYIRNCYVHDVNANPSPNLSATNNKNSGGIIFFGSNIDKDGNDANVNSGFNDILVESCKVYKVTKEGIRNKSDNNGAFPRVNSNIIFRNNHVEEVFGDGIVLGEIFEGGLIEYNFVKNVAYTNTANYAGIWTHYSTGSIIQFNEVCDMVGGMNDGEAFDADNNCNGDIFQYNYSHNNVGGFFLMMPSAQNIIIRYNISQNDGNGKELFHYTSNSYANNQIYNNTFYIGAGVSTTLFKGGNSSRTLRFYNNIIQVDGQVNKFADNPFSANSRFANNCFYPASISQINGPSQHPGLISTNPMLENPSATAYGLNQVNGFRLQATSPLINTGLNLNQNGGRDYLNTPLYISDRADIGAIEYPTPISTGQNNNPLLGILPVADSYVRNGSYANNNYGSASILTLKKDASSYEREVFLKFDLNSLTTTPSTGKLRLYLDDADTDAAQNTWTLYYVADDSWTENTLTWSNKPTSDNNALHSVSGVSMGNYIIFDVYNQLISEYHGDKVLSLRLVSTTSGSQTTSHFASKENLILSNAPQLITEQSPSIQNQQVVFWQDFDSSLTESDYLFNSGTGNISNDKSKRFAATGKNGTFNNEIDAAKGYKLVRPSGASGQSVVYINDLAFPDVSNVVAVLQFDLSIDHPSTTTTNFGLASGTPFSINFGSGYSLDYSDQNSKTYTSANFFFPTAGNDSYQLKNNTTAVGTALSGKNQITIVLNKTASTVSFTDHRGFQRNVEAGKFWVGILKNDHSFQSIDNAAPAPANPSINVSAIRFRTAANWSGYVALDNVSVSYIPTDGSGQVLPVKISAFTAKTRPYGIDLNWRTTTEQQLSHFIVERAAANSNFFSEIGQIRATGQAHQYHFTDYQALNGTNLYRLKAVDQDGKSQKSGIISAQKWVNNEQFIVYQDKKGTLNCIIQTEQAQNSRLVLSSISGQKIIEQNISLIPGSNSFTLALSTKGLYIVTWFGSKQSESRKIILK